MDKNISEAKRKLLDVLEEYAAMHGEHNLLRSILIQLGSIDPMYATDEELYGVLNDELSFCRDDVKDMNASITNSVLKTPSEFESWSKRSHVFGFSDFIDDTRYVFTKEVEKIAFDRYSARYADYKRMAPMEVDQKVKLIPYLIRCGLANEDDNKYGYYDGYTCTSFIPYIVTDSLVRYPEVYSLYLDNGDSPYWKFRSGAPVKNPYFMETLGSCMSHGRLSFNMIYDIETPILAENCYNLVKYGIVVNKETKHVIFMDKHRIVDVFHTVYSKDDYLK